MACAPMPTTSTGVSAPANENRPSPTWPSAFLPQHFTPPSAMTAHACAPPADIATTPLPSPTTSTGVGRSVVVPSPSWPSRLLPQHLTPPEVVKAHELNPRPAATAATPLDSPGTSSGFGLEALHPPGFPRFHPQHFSPPESITAQVPETWAMFVSSPACNTSGNRAITSARSNSMTYLGTDPAGILWPPGASRERAQLP